MSKLYLILSILISQFIFSQTISVTVYRSEFEKANDIIYDINDSKENISPYAIVSGNQNNYYSINSTNGQLKIANPIADAFNVINTDNLTVSIGTTTYLLKIVDAYDYYKNELLNNGYTILANDGQTYIDNASSWTAYNNLWGKGDAVENVDFRIAILKKNNTFPNQSVILWDVPSEANAYTNGAAVWCYTNLFWGNRKGIRSNLPNFPFKINSLSSLNLNFNFEKLFGTHEYKVALNLFTTDNPALANFSENKGDFFFIFDQINNFIPAYDYSLPDITIGGKPFAVRYDNMLNGVTYERRRVVVQNGEALTQGTLDLKALFDMFSNQGYLNTNQSIPNIQVGLEITNGFGGLRFNQLDFQISNSTLNTVSPSKNLNVLYPNPTSGKVFVNNKSTDWASLKVFNQVGQEIKPMISENNIDLSAFPKGIYYIKLKDRTEKIIKK